MGRYSSKGLTDLQASLDATAVLSDDYKSRIMFYASQAHSDGYAKGEEKLRERLKVKETLSRRTKIEDYEQTLKSIASPGFGSIGMEDPRNYVARVAKEALDRHDDGANDMGERD